MLSLNFNYEIIQLCKFLFSKVNNKFLPISIETQLKIVIMYYFIYNL